MSGRLGLIPQHTVAVLESAPSRLLRVAVSQLKRLASRPLGKRGEIAQASKQGRRHAGQKQRTDLKAAKPVRVAEACGIATPMTATPMIPATRPIQMWRACMGRSSCVSSK